MNTQQDKNLDLSLRIRHIVLEQSKRANVGHIGSALSITDIVACLYGRVLRGDPDAEYRDRFVLSKGHAALALYAALRCKGLISQDELDTFCGNGSLLGGHPENVIEGVDFSTGSLGQGLSIAAGSALAQKKLAKGARVYVLISDAECNEGSVWEAAIFSAHNQLSNLTVILDLNGQQAMGYTKDIADLSNVSAMWSSFGWDVHEVDGHDIDQMASVISELETSAAPPHILIANTVFGKGVPFMESKIEWHYLPMSDAEYSDALSSLGVQA